MFSRFNKYEKGYRYETSLYIIQSIYQTVGGYDQDDIPMQRIAAHEFIGRMPDWVLIREFEEKGISGSKVSASKRDAIQDLKELALRHEFDVLLVFMFDRLGRIESEMPFVLEWFVAHGIEMSA